jgi:hypothetical protein
VHHEESELISLEIIVNGQRRAVAGVAEAEMLTATVSLYPAVQDGWLDVSGALAPAGQPQADANWLSAALTVGDRVEVHLVDSDQPQAPTRSRTDPAAQASDTIPKVCAFCEKSAQGIEGMMSSRRAMICPSCVEYLHEMMHPSEHADE